MNDAKVSQERMSIGMLFKHFIYQYSTFFKTN